LWDFGDGGLSIEQNPTYTYNNSGTFTITLTVTDDMGQQNSQTLSPPIQVFVDTTPPSVPSLIWPINGLVTTNLRETFSWSESSDEGSGIKDYVLQLDTSQTFSSPDLITITGITETNYTASSDLPPNIWYFRVRAIDNAGNSGLYTGNCSPSGGLVPLTIDCSVTVDGGLPPYSFLWDFGDGGSSIEQNPSYTYYSPGTFTISLRVNDIYGQVESGSFSPSILVMDIPPITRLSETQLTFNSKADFISSFSPDGSKIVFGIKLSSHLTQHQVI
jgi:PKD repeat protein